MITMSMTGGHISYHGMLFVRYSIFKCTVSSGGHISQRLQWFVCKKLHEGNMKVTCLASLSRILHQVFLTMSCSCELLRSSFCIAKYVIL